MQPIIIGHRGAAGLLPENTLAGFRRAIELGVDAVECDVHCTREGQVVVMHDETVERTTDGRGRVAEMDLAEIRALDAGAGEPPPTLDELLELVGGHCGLLCEVKADAAVAPAVEAVKARGMAGEVTFISFSRDQLEQVKSLDGSLRIGMVMGVPRAEQIQRAAALGAEHVGVQYHNLSLAAVERVRAAGASVGAWTPNRLEDMQAMVALGVDAITTDRPDILLDYLRSLPTP